MKQIILGVDPGTRVTGYGIIQKQGNRFEALTYGVICSGADIPLEQRYLKIYEHLDAIIDQYQPTEICVETQFAAKNIQSTIKISMARAIVLLLAAKKGLALFEYSPKKAKLAVVGRGDASKEQVLKMVQLLLNLQGPLKEDSADALALAICHSHQLRGVYV